MPDSLNSLTTRHIEPGDTPVLAGFAHEFLGATWPPEFVAWKYFTNPQGRVYGRCAELAGRPVGFYGNIPLRLKLGGRVVPAAQAVDAVVVPEARRLGAFVRLAGETFRQMDGEGVLLDYVFPNPISHAGFIQRLGWSDAGAVPRFVHVLDPRAMVPDLPSFPRDAAAVVRWLRFALLWAAHRSNAGSAARHLAGVVIDETRSFDDSFDRVWEATSEGFPIAIVHDASYLNWRYARCPLSQYTMLTAKTNGRLAGYAVLSHRDVPRHGVLAVAELMVLPGKEEAGLALLSETEAHARALGCSQVQCWMLPQHGFYRSLLRRTGFIHWPFRLAPGALRYSTPFVIRLRPGTVLLPDPTDLSNWFLSMGDHDYY